MSTTERLTGSPTHALAHIVDEMIEAAAQVLHDRRHRLGSAPVCGTCRAAAAEIVQVLLPRAGDA